MTDLLTTSAALDQIAALLSGTAWTADTTDQIARIVRATGRTIADVTDTSEPALFPYRLPDGQIVLVDDSAAKGAAVIDFTLKRGSIVQATRANGKVLHVRS